MFAHLIVVGNVLPSSAPLAVLRFLFRCFLPVLHSSCSTHVFTSRLRDRCTSLNDKLGLPVPGLPVVTYAVLVFTTWRYASAKEHRTVSATSATTETLKLVSKER